MEKSRSSKVDTVASWWMVCSNQHNSMWNCKTECLSTTSQGCTESCMLQHELISA